MIPLPAPSPTGLSIRRTARPGCEWLCKMCSVGCTIATDAVRDETRRRATLAASFGDRPTAAQLAELAAFDGKLAFAEGLLREARLEALRAEFPHDKVAEAVETAPAHQSRRLPRAAAKPVTRAAATLRRADRDRIPHPLARRSSSRMDLGVTTGLRAR